MSSQPEDELDLMLNDIESRIEPTPEQTRRFEIDVLSLVEHKLPPLGRDGLTVARRFAAGDASESAVREALRSCWLYADQLWPGGVTPTAEACAIRSVISVLHGLINDQDDFVNSVSFFLELVNRVEPHYLEEAQLLDHYFGGERPSGDRTR